MAKIRLLVIFVTVFMIVSLVFNVYQWNSNLSLTKQTNEKEMPLILIQSQAAINAELLKLDRLLSNACQQLSTIGLTGTEAEKILNDLYIENPDIIVNAA